MHYRLHTLLSQVQGTLNPLLSLPPPPGGGLFEKWELTNLENTIVSVLYKELARILSGKAQLQEGWRSCC